MVAPVQSYHPDILVLIAGQDVTRHLGDQSNVIIHKNLYAPTGEARILFPDMPTEGRDSLYGVLNVMASIEIRLRRVGPDAGGMWVTVLRGFVRSIGRDEQVAGDGRVHRSVVVVAHDTGAAFVMEQLHPFITYQNKGVPLPAPFSWLREYQLTPKPFPVAQFVWDIARESTKGILGCAGWSFNPVLSVEKGTALAHQALSTDGPVWELLARYADRPWNELFVREGPDQPEFVFRPTPWRDIQDTPLPDAVPGPFWPVAIRDVISLAAHRDDAELVNHAWVQSPPAIAAANVQTILNSSGVLNAETRECFGDRIQIAATYLGPSDEDGLPSFPLPLEQQKAANLAWSRWILERLEWLKLAGSDIHQFERGQITIKGNPYPRVGDYFTLSRGAFEWDGYIVAITNDYAPYRRYQTTIEYIRGNQWVRRKNVSNPWDRERQVQLP